MNILKEIKLKIAKIIKAHAKEGIDIEAIAFPPDEKLGDLALPVFDLAKKLKKNPVQLAQDLAMAITGKNIIAKAEAAGPYLNFFLDKETLAKLVIDTINQEKNKFGQNTLGKTQKVMIEYSQPNPLKELHIGHFRNICLGAALVNLYRACNYKVIAANYYNDLGSHVAKVLWYWKKHIKEEELPEDKIERGQFLSSIYIKATAAIEADESAKTELSAIKQRLEKGDKELLRLWKKTRDMSIAVFEHIYQLLGVEFDAIFYESEMAKDGKKVVEKLLDNKIATVSDGATIVDLKPYGLEVMIILKSDGTALYATSDLALAQLKFKKYKIDQSLVLTDVRQSLYFKQLFKVLELMGFKEKMVHVPFDFVKLPEGIISSRYGTTATFLDVYAKCVEKATDEILKRHQDWASDKIEDTAKKIAQAALKFGMLKQTNNKIVTFDINEALSLEGFTGPYIQYAVVRINSILAKAPKSTKNFAYQHYLYENIEKSLLKKLASYPQVAEDILSDNDPSRLAHYLYGLASEFNKFYHEQPVLQAAKDIKEARLILISAIKQVISSGLAVLGIEVVEEM